MENSSIEDRIIMLLENLVFQGHSIENSSTLEEIGLDSLDKMELLMDIEDEFRIDIPDEVMSYLDTVEDVIGYIRKISK